MKLELKHIAPYLPYSLKGISIEENLGFEIVKGFSIYGKFNTISLITNVDDIDLDLFKPILRPLSDYEQFSEIVMEMTNYEIDMIDENPDLIMRITYEVMDKMFKNHIDVFGLIHKGLAIDINTLKL